MQRVVAVAVFHVATNWMSHVCRVYTYLVLATGLELILYERVFCGAIEHLEVCDSIFATIVSWRRICDVCLVVLQLVGDSAIVLLHLATHYCDIAAVVNNLMPVVLEYLFCLYVLGVFHESTCVAVEAVYNVCAAFLARP